MLNTFIGNIACRTDDKGRIFVPSIYRKVLQEMGSRHIIMRRDTDNSCLIFYPESVWQKKVEDLKSVLDEWNADDQLLLMQFMADAEVLDTDTQGRILLQKKTLEGIGANGDVLFVGMMDRFALWSPDIYEAKRVPQKSLADKIREKFQNARENKNEKQ